MYKCPICGNDDQNLIGFRNNESYCRKCLKFSNQNNTLTKDRKINTDIQLNLKYPLSSFQQDISNNLVKEIKKKDNLLVYAVCGAGKTEIIVQVIYEYLKKGEKVGIVIPRRDLVIELGKRIQDIFSNSKTTLVYGGHHQDIEGDIVILTSHQAFRYVNYFDLLIVDEIDAFPYKGDEVLKSLVLRASKGKIISLSATPSVQDLKDNFVFTLFKRYHNYPLPIPKIIIRMDFLLLLFLIHKVKKYLKENKYIFIYVPSIKEGHKLHKLLKKFFLNIFVYSSMKDKEKIMKEVREKKHHVIITTTILERGVTYKNLQVFVYKANEYIFDKATLIQIAGRVGRTIDSPTGDVYFLSTKLNIEMKEAVKEIKKYNDL